MSAPPYIVIVSDHEAARARIWLSGIAVFVGMVVALAAAYIASLGDWLLVSSATMVIIASTVRESARLLSAIRSHRLYRPVAGRVVAHWHQAVVGIPMGYRDPSNSLFDVRLATVRAPEHSAVTCFLRILPRGGGRPRTVIVPLDVYLYVVTYDVRDFDPNDPIH